MSYAQILRSSRQPGGYEAQIASLMPPEEEQQQTRITPFHLKGNPDLASRAKDEKAIFAVNPAKPRVSSYRTLQWLAFCADFEIDSLHKRVKKIEHFINGITQNGFADVLTENATLLSETTALKDKIQELEETLENMQARVDELCKERQVSTVQNNPARKKRAMPQ
ncbi:hypothetical protein PCH_Pc13g00700 [Penicillium rubens Wisconsin 54-1255]|uniref:Uncharacterized protein n=1 Tax=Penicillium rubens (strain ATCC 28089 / DSM 1075 / NRRL 1951 / Wisconsin 54-1255) TaxID=500485 RepID=B6H147_PENRW|nr:hypothetical protein PCH_Pc13g00700 [Penicillium rubens Wisconsin 54-1255]